jgi:hypothetical protein
LHKSIYEFYNGPVLPGFELHHIDFNKENNEISNIKCLSIRDHKKIHNEDKKKKYGNNWNKENIKKARIGLRKWFDSKDYVKWVDENRERIRENARMSYRNRKKIKIKCDVCGKYFSGYKERKKMICSPGCWAKYRRDEGLDNVKKNCIICGNVFISNKFKKNKTCSDHCRAVYGYSNRGKN